MRPFIVDVDSVEEGVKILKVLAAYDLFQLYTNVKPDYSNAGWMEMWDEEENEWIDWEYEVSDKWFTEPEEYLDWKQSQ